MTVKQSRRVSPSGTRAIIVSKVNTSPAQAECGNCADRCERGPLSLALPLGVGVTALEMWVPVLMRHAQSGSGDVFWLQ